MTAVPNHESRITNHGGSNHDSRFTLCVVFPALLILYSLTLAPDVTLWDAGEFQAATASLGIPHPPGTPLYILLAATWVKALGGLSFPFAVNLLSAVATAIACGLLGGLITRWTGDRIAGIAAGLAAGSMLAVWQNATETEVYALSMLLGILMVVAGDRAGELDSRRHRLLLAFFIALAVPLQISALVAAPAAIFLASSPRDTTGLDRTRLVTLGSILVFVTGAGLAKGWLMVVGAVGVLASVARRPRAARWEAVSLLAVAVLGISATLFMLVRAPHDPLVNQGNPATWTTFVEVVARSQYPLPGLWPRQAPVWIQLLSFVQYADWQVASGLDLSVAASWWRTPWSVAALALAVAGFRWHRAVDRRGAWGLGVLFLGASLGIIGVLNLKAGPSILPQFLPEGARPEPRERDYFFALAFATTAAWLGAGAVMLARRWFPADRRRLAAAAGLAIAALPVALNWNAANRRMTASLAPALGEALLASAPPRAVLFLAGDNDSYTVWYRQAVHGQRLDVVPVTLPLLGATWYRAELARRYQLLDPASVARWSGEDPLLAAIAEGARQQGRPVAAALTLSPEVRQRVRPSWAMRGLAFVADEHRSFTGDRVDTAATRAIAALIAERDPREAPARDPAVRWAARLLRCPAAALQLGTGGTDALLDSRCNLR